MTNSPSVAVHQIVQIFLRHLRSLLRQPTYILFTLFQPMVWLVLFGAVFRSVSRIPGFRGSYIEFFAPGILVMFSVFSTAWIGMGTIDEIQSGVLERVLASPVFRASLNAGTAAFAAFLMAVQAIPIVGISLILGADFKGGAVGVGVMVLVAILLAIAVASFSTYVALICRRRETAFVAIGLVELPINFLSTAMMQTALLPHWVQVGARYNPVNWAVVAARSAAVYTDQWRSVGEHVGLLALLAFGTSWLAARAYGRFSRSL